MSSPRTALLAGDGGAAADWDEEATEPAGEPGLPPLVEEAARVDSSHSSALERAEWRPWLDEAGEVISDDVAPSQLLGAPLMVSAWTRG